MYYYIPIPGVLDTFFSSFFVPRFFRFIIIVILLYRYCVVYRTVVRIPTCIRTARVSLSVFFQLPRDFRTDAVARTHKTTAVVVVGVRLRFTQLYIFCMRAQAFVCMWFTSDNHGPSSILCLFITWCSRNKYPIAIGPIGMILFYTRRMSLHNPRACVPHAVI